MKRYVENIMSNMFYSLSLTIITLAIYFNPSNVPPFSEIKSVYVAVLLCGLLSGFFYLLVWYLSRLQKVVFFLINLFVQCLIIVSICIYLGLCLHRDYFSGIFIIITIYYSIFISKIDIFKSGKLFYKSIHFFTAIIIIVIFTWLLLMGYSIVKREEPRWIESIFYNVYFLFLIVVLYYKNFKISYLIKRIIKIKGDEIYIDGFSLSDILGKEYLKILKTFIECKKANCFILNQRISNSNVGCTENCDNKPHQCNYYRNLYNKINFLKKILELLRLGTIKNPDNKMLIKEEGWVICLEKDCIVEFE